MKWWQNVGLIDEQADVTKSKVDSILGKLKAAQEQRRIEQENRLTPAERMGQNMSLYLKELHQQNAADEIRAVNQNLQAIGQNPIEVNESSIKQQMMSGHMWTQQIEGEISNATRSSREKAVLDEAEEWAKWRSDQGGVSWSKLSPDERNEKIQGEYQKLLYQYYPKEYPELACFFDMPV